MKNRIYKIALIACLGLIGFSNKAQAAKHTYYYVEKMDYQKKIDQLKSTNTYTNDEKFKNELDDIVRKLSDIKKEREENNSLLEKHELENGDEPNPYLLSESLLIDQKEDELGERLLHLALSLSESENEVSPATIIVADSYKYIREGEYSASDLLIKRDNLNLAIDRNKTIIDALEYVFNETPATIADVRDELDRLYTKSKKLTDNAQKALAECDELLSNHIENYVIN